MKRYITLVPMLLVAALGMAQMANDSINRTVLVESTYNPIIAGAVKRSFIPEEVKPSMNREEVVYANENVDLTSFERTVKKAALAEVAPEKGLPGYAHLGYGNYNNLAALAAYRWNINTSHALAFKAHADGWNGKYKLDDGAQWRSHRYDLGLDADYTALLGEATLGVGLRGAYHNYDYMNDARQQSDILGGHVALEGLVGHRYNYRAAVSLTHFGRDLHFGVAAPHSENHIRSEVALGMDLYDWGTAEVQISSDLLTYGGDIADYSTYHALAITPRWNYYLGDFHFVAGMNLDILTGKNMGSPVQASPECAIHYTPNKVFAATLTLDGGRDVHTFSDLYARSPYWAAQEQVRPTYTYMNAHLEAGVRIIEGLHLHLGGGYRILSDALLETRLDTLGCTYTGLTNHKAQVATIDGKVSYTLRDLVGVGAKATYNYWMLKGDRALLARAPQFTMDVDARVRIIPNLYGYTNLHLVAFTNTASVARERAIIDWSLGADYALNRHFSFFLDGNNLLNRRYSYYTGYPAQGISVLAGARVKF